MLGTSYGTLLMLEYAKSQGVHTIVTDYLEPAHSPGKQVANEYWMISTGELDELEAHATKFLVLKNGKVVGAKTAAGVRTLLLPPAAKEARGAK